MHAEEERLNPLIERGEYRHHWYDRQSYKTRGIYHEQLRRYFEHFSREQMLIIQGEQFYTHPVETLERMFAFVGVDPQYRISDLRPRNVSRKRTDVEPRVYEYLEEYFRPHNRALAELLGEDFGW